MSIRYLKKILRKIPGSVPLYWSLKCMGIIPDKGYAGFHEDRAFQRIVETLISSLPISSFIETGTYMGESTAYVASRWHDLQVFTCEINDEFFSKARQRLKKFKNVELSKTSSQEYIKQLVENKRVGDLPLFFLDAHWFDYWPIKDEIRTISFSCPTAIVIIDDFEVPGQPEFGFDIYEMGACCLPLIEPELNRRNVYNALLPSYKEDNAFPRTRKGLNQLRGYIVIFQNLEAKFNSLRQRPSILHDYSESVISL